MAAIDIEQLLLAGSAASIPLTGTSMFPLFVGGRDRVTVAPVPADYRFKRLDVVLYRRPGSRLVLHRIYKVTPEGLYLVGDHQTEIEGPLPAVQVRGIMTGALRKGKSFTTKNIFYKMYSAVWMLILPIRFPVLRVLIKVKKIIGR